MDEQLLKDFLETAKQNQYNWDVIMPKFPELEGIDLQLLKDYTETAIKYNYDYDVINPKFPEFFGEQYEVKKKDESTFVAPKQDGELVTEDTSLDTQETPETTEYQTQNILEPIESEDAEFEASLKTSVTPEMISEPEEFVVPEMQYKFGKYGFDFEESTTNLLGTDAMLVKVRGTDKKLKVKLDRLWGKKGTSKELEKFLRENKRKESEILKQSQAIVQNQRTVQTEEELNATIKLFNQQSERFQYEVNEYSKARAELDSIYNSNFSNLSKELRKNNPVLKANYDEWLKQSNELDLKLKDIEGKYEDFKYKGAKLDKIAGEYTAMKAQQGTWWSGFWNEMMGGAGPTFSPMSSIIDLGTYLDEKMIEGDTTRGEEYKKDIIKIAKKKGLAPEGLNEDMSLDEVVEALGGDTNDVKLFFDSIVTKGFLNTPNMARARAMKTGSTKGGIQEKEKTNFDIVQDALLDIERKNKKYYEPKVDPSDPEGKRLISARERAFTDAMSDDPKFRNPFSVVGAQKDNFGNKGMVSAGRDAFNFLKDKSTTEQWAEVQKQGNFLKKGFLGLGGSLPAMLGTSSPLGWAQRTAQMYNMSTDYVDQEMEKNPMFDKISEAEKTQVKMPIGIATAVLENIGLRNVISQKGLLNSLVSKALRKSNKNTTAKTFQEFIRQDIESMIARGALVVTGGALAEFETGFAQEIAAIEIKDVYNATKEAKMFETPETFATYMGQVVEAGLAEMVGGFVIGSIPAVTTAVSGLDIQNLQPEVFEIFEKTIQEPTLKSAYISKLKNRIADPSSELDAKEAQKELELVNKLEGILVANRIPFDEFNTNQRKEALQLLLQKETLENEIKEADKVLSKPKQELLDRVNKKLEELTGESIDTQEEAEIESEGITQFDSTLEEGKKIVEESVADIDEFRSLEQDEQIKFLDQAGKELLEEAESRGETEIEITEAQSLQRAVELFKKDQQQKTEAEVDDEVLMTPQEIEKAIFESNVARNKAEKKGDEAEVKRQVEREKYLSSLLDEKTKNRLSIKNSLYSKDAVEKKIEELKKDPFSGFKFIQEQIKILEEVLEEYNKIEALEDKKQFELNNRKKPGNIKVKDETSLNVVQKIEQRIKTIANISGQKRVLNRLNIFKKSSLPENYKNLLNADLELVNGSTVKIKDVMDMSFKEFSDFANNLNTDSFEVDTTAIDNQIEEIKQKIESYKKFDKIPVKTTPKAEVKAEPVVEEEVDDEVVYEMNKTNKKIWSKDFEILDNRQGQEQALFDEEGNKTSDKWWVVNKVTGQIIEVGTKAMAKDVIANAPAYAEAFGDGTKVEANMLVTPAPEAETAPAPKAEVKAEPEAEVEETMTEAEIDAEIEKNKKEELVIVRKIEALEKKQESLRGKPKQKVKDEIDEQFKLLKEIDKKDVSLLVRKRKISEKKTDKETQEEQEDIKEFFKDELGESISPNLNINKEGKSEKVNNLKPRIIKIAKASARSIAKLLPKTKIVLHESKSEYFKYTGKKGKGYYDPITDTIHIDLTNAKLSTVPHEVFHAVFLNKLKTDAKARAMAIKMVESVKKTLSKNSKLYKEIDAFSKLYTGDQAQFQEEEFIAELIGLMSSQEFKNYKQLKAPAKYAIVEFLKKIAKKFGIKLGSNFGKDDQSVIDLINVLATKTVTGEEITEQDVKILDNSVSGVMTANSRLQADFYDSFSGMTYMYDKNTNEFKQLKKDGYITTDKSITNFNGKYVFFHQPDAAFSGIIAKNGEILVEGKGGMYYPIKFHKDGFFWASTDNAAQKMAEDLNKVSEQNGGTIFMALTSAPYDKLLSSTTMSNAVLDFFTSKMLDKTFAITNNETSSSIKKTLSKVTRSKKVIKETVDKKTGKKIPKKVTTKLEGLALESPIIIEGDYSRVSDKLPSSVNKKIKEGSNKIYVQGDLDATLKNIKEKLGAENSSFNGRKSFSENLINEMAGVIKNKPRAIKQFGKLFSEGIQNKYFKGITKTGKISISKANMIQALSEMLTEPILKDNIDREKGGQIYAILEVSGKVTPVDSKKHESYPKALKSEGGVKINILTDRVNWSDVTEDFQTNEIVSEDRRNKIYPTSGVSVRGLKINTSNISKQVAPQSRKQKVYRAGDLTNKAEPIFRFDTRRSTGHFGTGFYFFSKQKDAQDYAKRTGTKTSSRIVTSLNLDDYNLAPGSLELHEELKDINNDYSNLAFLKKSKKNVSGYRIGRVANILGINVSDSLLENYSNSVTKKLRNSSNKESASTLIMKALGFEGVNSTGTELDNGTYGTVIYDIKKPQSREQKSVSELESNLESKYNVTLDLYQNKDFLELDKIIVTEDQRNTGVGSNVMREVIDFANKKGLTIALTPSTSYGATSIDRLKGFYKGLGFVENKGINKDFTTKQSMLKLPEVKGRESKIPVTIPADLDQQIDELKVRIEAESVMESEKDKAGKEAYTKKFFDNYQLLKDELKTLELLKEGLVPAYSQRVALAEKLNDLNKPFMKEVGNEFYPRQGTVKKGKKIKEDKDLGGVFEVDASGYLFRGVSRADFNRVRSTGIIDTDLRGAISEKEGINLAPNASTAFNYLPEGVEGVVMAIKVDKDMDLFMIGADDYVRSSKPIPYQNVKVITTPTIEGRYLEIKDNEIFKLRGYSVNEEVQVKPKKEKTIYDIADSYYYSNGYFNAKPAPDLRYLKREVESVPGNYSVKKADGGGLFLTQNNRIKKDLYKAKGREQKSTQQIINEGRQANFKESNIRDFLVRVLNRSAKEVDKLMSLDKDFLEVVPKSFTNIEGGIKAGTKLYNRVEAYRKKLVKKNDKLKGNKKLTNTQIIDKTIEYLQKQPEYINEGDKYTVGSKKKGTQETRVRKGFSTQQARMLADYTKTAGVRPTNNMGAKIRKAMAAVRQKVKGARDLQKQKTALRNFIRQSLPKALYTKKDAIDLVNKVNDVNAGNIENLMKEVIEFVNKTNVKSLQAQIKSILNKKYSKVESGRKKPVKISDDIRKRIDFINSIILNDKATPAQIGDALINLQNRFNELAAEVNQTEEIRSEMVDLELAMMYINTLQLEDTNETKVEQLDQIVQTLKEMIEDGRSQLKEQIREQHLYYLQQFELGYEAITGNKIDMNEPDAFDELNKIKKIFENEKAKRDTQNVIKRFLRSLREGIDRNFFASAEDLFSLMDRLDKLPGEMYGGNLQEMFTERVDEATRLFKGRMMLVEQLIQQHLKEVYGKKWKKQSRQNRLAKDTGIMIQDGVPLSPKSQNQIAYLYNMYKDPANRKSFANPEMYGIKTIPKDATKAEREAIQALNEENAGRVMSEMIALLDPKVKETADWQVNELYPFLYNHYNDAYKKLYRTDLPWNEFYAGTIYREGVDQEEASILDLQNARNIYSTAVGASGTKVRENSNKAIQNMDMMDVLNTYLNQMEYFAAYGEVIRDMSKLFNNKYISDAITKIHGKDVYKYTLAIIDKIASRGTSDSRGNTIVNAMNNVFILSRLAISPVIMIKQLTSFITYANDIGPLNYLKYAAKNKVEMLKVYKEIRDNSVYMKDRQRTSIMRAIETYSDANMKKFVPAGTKDWIVNFAMWTTKFGDKSAIFLGGMPNYSYYKAQFKKKNPGATEQEAIDYAVKLFERDTKRTQQSGDLQDKDYYQTKDPLYRGLNMFLTTPKQYLRKEIVAIRNLNRKLSQFDRKAGKGTVAQNLRTFFMYHVIMPVFFQYVSMGLPGILRDERDDDKLDLLRAAMIGNLNALFIVGDLFQMAGDLFTGKPWAGSNVKTVGLLSIAGSLTEKFAYAAKLKDPAKKAEAYQKAYLELATFTSVPAPTIAKFVENYGNIGKDGDIGKDILRLLNFSKYQIEGPGKGGRPKKIKTIQELNEEYDKKKAKEQRSIPINSRIFGPSSRRKSKSSSKIF